MKQVGSNLIRGSTTEGKKAKGSLQDHAFRRYPTGRPEPRPTTPPDAAETREKCQDVAEEKCEDTVVTECSIEPLKVIFWTIFITLESLILNRDRPQIPIMRRASRH